MPELPEVETVRRGLETALSGSVIEEVTLRRKDLRIAFPPNLKEALTGRTIRSIARRAKYLLFMLDSNDVVIAHLGMSGRFLISFEKPKKFSPHDHLVIELEDGRYLIFNDTRRFGLLTLTQSKKLNAHPLLARLGPEPLDKAFDAAYLRTKLDARKTAIKPALMDQHLVVGVGNIYASEALFSAGIDPRRACNRVGGKADELVASIRKTLKSAIDSGGSTLRDFLNVGGKTGYFQHNFYVYGRENKPCLVCRTPIKTIRQSGRATFFCPSCQK